MNRLEIDFGMENISYFEAHHIENLSLWRYKRIWESVNDVQVQLGEKKFKEEKQPEGTAYLFRKESMDGPRVVIGCWLTHK